VVTQRGPNSYFNPFAFPALNISPIIREKSHSPRILLSHGIGESRGGGELMKVARAAQVCVPSYMIMKNA
jgi:hypothetical protein